MKSGCMKSMVVLSTWGGFYISTVITSLIPKRKLLLLVERSRSYRQKVSGGRVPNIKRGRVNSRGSNHPHQVVMRNRRDGAISALCLYYDDLAQARVTIHETQKQYLDARNFSDGNTTADPTQEKRHLYFIDTKSLETDESVEFALSSPMDLQGMMIPTRQYHSICTWCIRNQYRSGDGCDYAGAKYFDKNNKPVDDPSQDVCNGTLTACKLRFGENNELSFGGFPGTSLIRS